MRIRYVIDVEYSYPMPVCPTDGTEVELFSPPVNCRGVVISRERLGELTEEEEIATRARLSQMLGFPGGIKLKAPPK